jgi:hypothetical protein
VFKPLDTIKFTSSHSESNVFVYVYDTEGNEDMLVNDIGNFSGEFAVPKDALIWTVQSDGAWTIKRT